jgi:heme oxygenase (mycobilin-producing)
MFVALSQFTVVNGMANEVKEAFRKRPHLVDAEPGFIRLDVITPVENPDEFWLLTYWTDEQSFRQWHRGHTYHSSHKGIPKGLKLDPKQTRLTYFEHVSS